MTIPNALRLKLPITISEHKQIYRIPEKAELPSHNGDNTMKPVSSETCDWCFRHLCTKTQFQIFLRGLSWTLFFRVILSTQWP